MSIRAKIRKVAGFLSLHTALVFGAIIFSAPFVWLMSTSAKSPDELYPPRWRVPLPDNVAQSPYMALRDNERAVRPFRVTQEDWDRQGDEIRLAIAARISGFSEEMPAFFRPHLGHPELVECVFVRLLRRAPDELFSASEAECAGWFAENVTVELVQSAFDQVYRRVALSGVSFIGRDMTLESTPNPLSIVWRVVSGTARITPRPEGFPRISQEIAYDFSESQTFSVQTVLPLRMPEGNLKKIGVSNRGDRSWHSLWVSIEISGKRFDAIEPCYLRNTKWQDTTWQFASEEDRAVMVKNWLILKESGPSDFREQGQVRLTLTYRRSSPWRAAFAKCFFNYGEVRRQVPLWRYVRNSMILVVLNIFGQIMGSSLVAFAFARLRWPGREFCFLLVLATLMIPPQVTLVPVFLVFKQLGWYNTLRPLWVPAFFGSAFYIFLLRQFMRTVPTDLEDSAKIDGCGFFGIYLRVILPLIKPALAAIAIFTFMAVWNDFMGPLIFVADQELYPLSLGLFSLYAMVMLFGQYEVLMAAAVLMTVPVVILFFAAQRHFIQGITLTGLKG